jgi:hypothetical protein
VDNCQYSNSMPKPRSAEGLGSLVRSFARSLVRRACDCDPFTAVPKSVEWRPTGAEALTVSSAAIDSSRIVCNSTVSTRAETPSETSARR